MANSDYTFNQVLNGTGSYSVSGDTGYSAGVETMQTYLSNVGYTIAADGRFGTGTKSAVTEFQRELGITQDGVAGQATITRINTVRSSAYWTSYGARLENSAWGQANILAGNFVNIDLLARIIYAEDNAYTNAQGGIAIVIKKRSGSTSYQASSTTYPNASVWARVVGKSGQYSTANAGTQNAQKPTRGYNGTSASYNLPINSDQKIGVAKVGQTMLYEEKLYSEVQSRSSA
jgi:peptidoglycan hydrolase-like protein with peptidoglycan-binding domain